jgi:hypothetical protein
VFLILLQKFKKLFVIDITKILLVTLINVLYPYKGFSKDNYCTFCCVGEFGNEYEKEKMECLDKCMEVKIIS